MSDQKIFAYDDYQVFDYLASQIKPGIGPVGWVKIFMKTKNGIIFDEGQNLVIAQGREFIAQKISNCITYSTGSRVDWRSYMISHFAVGKGGSYIDTGGNVVLNGPFITDTRLIDPINLGVAGYLTEPSTLVTSVKPITASSGSVILEPQSFTGGGVTSSYYTKIKCTCIISNTEPVSLSPGQYVKIDEAGLYFTLPSPTPPSIPLTFSDAHLFAHICFAPKYKEKETTITLEWYILC